MTIDQLKTASGNDSLNPEAESSKKSGFLRSGNGGDWEFFAECYAYSMWFHSSRPFDTFPDPIPRLILSAERFAAKWRFASLLDP